jgi:hypothetical protein
MTTSPNISPGPSYASFRFKSELPHSCHDAHCRDAIVGADWRHERVQHCRQQGAADVSSAELLLDSSAGKMPTAPCGSWKAPFRLCACTGTMNRFSSRARRKAPINRTHSRRFARFGDARLSRSVWSACVFSRLPRRFPKAGCESVTGSVRGEPPVRFFECIGTMNRTNGAPNSCSA